MSNAGERWDVVVVGLNDPRPEQRSGLAAAIARRRGIAIGQVEQALREGEVAAHVDVLRHEAERVAQELEALGAAVDLRLSNVSSGAYPILKPDAQRRSGTAVGGFIDDSATPPRIAAHDVAAVTLEPEVGALAGSRRAVTLEPDAAASAPAVGRRAPTIEPDAPIGTRRRVAPDPALSIATRPEPAFAGGLPELIATPAPTPPPGTLSPAHADDPFEALASGLDRIVAGDAEVGMLGTLGGEPDAAQPRDPRDRPTPREGRFAAIDPDAPPPPRGAASREPDRSTAPRVATREPDPPSPRVSDQTASAREPDPPPPRASNQVARVREPDPPPPRASNQVAGVREPDPPPPRASTPIASAREPDPPPPRANVREPDPPPPRASARGPEPAAAGRSGVDRSRSAAPALELDYAAAGIAAPARPMQAHVHRPGSPEAPPRRTRATDLGGTGVAAHGPGTGGPRPLMGPEPVSATMFGLAAGLAVGMVAAVLWQRVAPPETLDALETELHDTLVRATESPRAAAAIEADLEAVYADARQIFLLTWLAIGLPIGLVLARLKRSS